MDKGQSQGNGRAAVATVTAYHGCPSAASAAVAARCCLSFVLARPHPSLTSFSSLLSLASFRRACSSDSVGRLCKRPGGGHACPAPSLATTPLIRRFAPPSPGTGEGAAVGGSLGVTGRKDNGHHGRRAPPTWTRWTGWTGWTRWTPRTGRRPAGRGGAPWTRDKAKGTEGLWWRPKRRTPAGLLQPAPWWRRAAAVHCLGAPPAVHDVLFVLAVLVVHGVLPGAPAPAVAWVVCASGPAVGMRARRRGAK